MNRLKGYFNALAKYRYLLEDLISRDIKVKYRRSVLGLVWSVLNPLLMMMVISAVFSHIFRFEVENFPIYYLTGSTLYNFYSESTSSAMTSMTGAGALIKKVYIPKYIFPLEKALFAFVNMLFSMIAVVLMIFILRAPVHWTLLLSPIPMLYMLVFCIGIGLILSALSVFFRDLLHLYGVFLTALVYMAPIIYPMEAIAGNKLLVTVVKCNPLYYYIDYFRQLVMKGTIPGLTENLICIGFAVVFLALGLWVFKKCQDKFILYI
ncbi:ABC transporter permease [Neobittarella massiliensis]|uniref:Transport permease protein n=1 Tax=uncultured Anaerotruncus sp. TaxID=905011 RepID=A0A1C6JYC6_9FIRM|nr:ABC transporter permease [Neobittarella massiliensis]SCJ87003.1 ABC-2 type transporter [uncultured Anaerotruncus sp.]